MKLNIKVDFETEWSLFCSSSCHLYLDNLNTIRSLWPNLRWSGLQCDHISGRRTFLFYNHNDCLKAQKNAQQIYFPKQIVMAFTIPVHMIVIFYSTFIIIIIYFKLLQLERTGPRDGKDEGQRSWGEEEEKLEMKREGEKKTLKICFITCREKNKKQHRRKSQQPAFSCQRNRRSKAIFFLQ